MVSPGAGCVSASPLTERSKLSCASFHTRSRCTKHTHTHRHGAGLHTVHQELIYIEWLSASSSSSVSSFTRTPPPPPPPVIIITFFSYKYKEDEGKDDAILVYSIFSLALFF